MRQILRKHRVRFHSDCVQTFGKIHVDVKEMFIIGVAVSSVESYCTMLECNRHKSVILTGSACQVGKQAPSRTMTAIGKNNEVAKQFVRISLGKWTTANDMETVISVLKNICSQFSKERSAEKE